MKISSCLTPLIVRNKYNHELVSVPCGKCAACRGMLNNNWTFRLEQERQCWPYCLFFTLTYSDDNIPTFDVDFYHGDFISNDCSFNVNDLYSYLNKNRQFWHLSDDEYQKNLEFISIFMNRPFYPSVSDCQKFIKRFRYFITQLPNYDPQQDQIRYFMVSEYGETTFRPHYHGLFFFRSERIKENFEMLLSKSWKLGIKTCELATGGCTSYVANYLNCTYNLPRIFSFKALRTFHLSSRRPPIGSLLADTAYIRKLFDRIAVTETLYDRRNNTFIDAPLRPFIKNRLFPKIKDFAHFTPDERVALYSVASKANDFEEFYTSFKFKASDESQSRTFIISLLENYCTTTEEEPRRNCLKRLWLISKRVLLQTNIFNLTIRDYVHHITTYYDKVAHYNLKKFYEFQQDYVKTRAVGDIVAMYPLYLSDLLKGNYHSEEQLNSFGINKDYDTEDIKTLDKLTVFQRFQSDVIHRTLENAKTHHIKDFYRTKYNINF